MTAKRIGRFYVLLNGVNDVAYFGFLTLQFLLLEPTLRALLPEGRAAMSIGLTIVLIASQLLWQIFAEGPTGAFADAYGRARAVAMSFWCRLAAIILIVVCVLADLRSDSPAAARVGVVAALILAQMLTAVGEAFLEGSIEAWLRDECEIAAPDCYKQTVNQAFDESALVQNVAILFTVVAVLTVWEFTGEAGGIMMVIAAGCLCLAGALTSHKLSGLEAFTGEAARPVSLRAGGIVMAKQREALAAVVRSDDTSVRRLVAILILPFPCWVMLSWFFTAFVRSGGAGGASNLSATYTLWLGVSLGVARVLGAWVGSRLDRRGDGNSSQVVFEKSVFFNVLFLSSAALLLVLRSLLEGAFSPAAGVALFLPLAALAKGSEEVIKLSKNKFLASTLPDASVRATTLSFISAAQNAFGFVAICLSSLLAYLLASSESQQPVIIFAVCASSGVLGWVVWQTLSHRRKESFACER